MRKQVGQLARYFECQPAFSAAARACQRYDLPFCVKQ
jgi:hypothetical protein